MRLRLSICALATALGAGAAACSRAGEPAEPADAGEEPFDVAPFEGSPPPTACGAAQCEVIGSEAEALGVTRCCSDAGACGLAAPITVGCLPPDRGGALDLDCPGALVAGGVELRGCCAANGRCGVRDDVRGLGCADRESLGLEAVDCEFDAANECTAFVEIACDGPEDCDGGRCCGRLLGGRFDAFECAPSCAATGSAGVWFEVCHTTSECSDKAHECLTSPEMPPFLARCYLDGTPAALEASEAGVIRCGEGECIGGLTCCARSPTPPVCSAKGACACEDLPTDANADAPEDASAG